MHARRRASAVRDQFQFTLLIPALCCTRPDVAAAAWRSLDTGERIRIVSVGPWSTAQKVRFGGAPDVENGDAREGWRVRWVNDEERMAKFAARHFQFVDFNPAAAR